MAVIINLRNIFGKCFQQLDGGSGLFCGHGLANVNNKGRRITLMLKGEIDSSQNEQQLNLYGKLVAPVGVLGCNTQLASCVGTLDYNFEKRELCKGTDYLHIDTITFHGRILRQSNVKSTAEFNNTAVEFVAKYRINISNARFECVHKQCQLPRDHCGRAMYDQITCKSAPAANLLCTGSGKFYLTTTDDKTYCLHQAVLQPVSAVLAKHYEGIIFCI